MTSDLTIAELQRQAHAVAKSKGFWDAPRNKGELIALMHSELSECLEGIRKHCPDDHLPAFSMEIMELADTVIRIADYAEAHGMDLTSAIMAKLEYNAKRPHMHGGKAF